MLLRPVLMPILRNPLQGIADGIRNMLAELLGSSQFFAPLTHSLVLARGTGSPTFTRVDPTPRATFRDWEGWLRTVPSGCARFEGARMVRNLLTFTEDFSNAAWTKINGGAGSAPTVTSGFADPEGGTTAWRLQADAGGTTASDYSVVRQVVSATSNGLRNIYLKSNTASAQVVYFGGADLGNEVTATTSWQRLSVLITASNTLFDIGSYRPGGVGTSAQSIDVLIWHPQLEDVTGQADQTASEYVSVGVESAPYHGAGVDGVEFFNTDRDGALLSPQPAYLAEGARTNLCLQSNAFTTTWTALGTPAATQNLVGPDGGTTGWTVTDNDAGAAEGLLQTYGALTAANYSQSIFIKKTSGATSFPIIRLNEPVGANEALCTVDTNNGVATVWTAFTGSTIVTSSASCVSHNADWWRVNLVFLASTQSWRVIFYLAGTTNATQSTGTAAVNVTGTCGIYGAQVELGSSASTYIPTTTAAVTRAADVDANPTASNILAAASTVYLEFTPDHTPSGTIALWGTYVDASNYTAILHDATNMIMRKRIAGVNYDATIANAFSANTTYKVCGSWGAAGVTITLDGTEGTPHANTTAAQIAATMQWGADGNSLQQPFATERNARVWQRQLSASERGATTS